MSFLKKILPVRFLITAFLPIYLTSCHHPTYKPPLPGIENEMVMRVVLPYALQLQEEKKLFLVDSVAYYGGDGTYIKKIMLNFTSQSIVELKQAREMLVDVVDGLIDSLNQDPVLGPLIASYPLTSDDLEVCIKFESYLGLYIDKLYIHWMMLQNKRSYFYAFDMTNEFNIWDRDCECWHERVEPFYKSRQIVTIGREAEKAMADKKPKSDLLLSPDNYINSNQNKRLAPSL